MRKKALFYSLHSFLWHHAYPERLIAEALEKEGLDVHVVTCDRAVNPWCVAMEATGAPESLPDSEKEEEYCGRCVKNKDLLRRHFPLPTSDLGAYLNAGDRARIEELASQITPANLQGFQLEGIPAGKAALYNFTLNRKKNFDDGFSPEEWKAFLLHFRSFLISFFGGRNALAEHAPDFVFFYSSSYSINLAVRLQAEGKGIPCFSIYAGGNWGNRFQRMHVSPKDSFSGFETRLKLWSGKYRDKPATREALAGVRLFKETTLRGKSTMVYGGGLHRPDWRGLRKSRNIKEDQKVLFMATSSNDELQAAQAIGALPAPKSLAFGSQLEWNRETIAFVEKRKDLFLVIRVHPRELPNRREATKSAHSDELEKSLRSLPDNVSVNWPQDGLSLYDWLEVIDLGLTSWSSAGKEFALWGIPNLSYASELCLYPARDLGWTCGSKEDYFRKIDEGLRGGWSEERLLLSHRYMAYELEGPAFDLSDAIPDHLGRKTALGWRLFDKLTFRRFAEAKWLLFHRRPLAQSPLIARKVLTGAPSEDVLEETRRRLSPREEAAEIREGVRLSADLLFGRGWDKGRDPSPLREKLTRI